MPIRKANRRVEVLEIDGSEVHAIKPDKSAWDEYTDAFVERGDDGEAVFKNSRGLRALYRACIKLLKNVETIDEAGVASVKDISDPDEIVDFISHLSDISVGQKIDNWLLGLGELSAKEAKN
jgi:hypothetical protein